MVFVHSELLPLVSRIFTSVINIGRVYSQVNYLSIMWKSHIIYTLPVNKADLTGTEPVNKAYLTRTVPINKVYLT